MAAAEESLCRFTMDQSQTALSLALCHHGGHDFQQLLLWKILNNRWDQFRGCPRTQLRGPRNLHRMMGKKKGPSAWRTVCRRRKNSSRAAEWEAWFSSLWCISSSSRSLSPGWYLVVGIQAPWQAPVYSCICTWFIPSFPKVLLS